MSALPYVLTVQYCLKTVEINFSTSKGPFVDLSNQEDYGLEGEKVTETIVLSFFRSG